ncbi:hypothetical protein BCR35DRAFT_89579 [Leucosporidium creatinivorum]|uniref:Uncharacterized protein n=1 Tax=Leucosporidium creatinivorum TaxID=106004 RepID=A0A1Y2F9W9_9BASI|nr:hypothetical protein BCR35DRAFT_89579 [Leucosporidium creatinivorum]
MPSLSSPNLPPSPTARLQDSSTRPISPPFHPHDHYYTKSSTRAPQRDSLASIASATTTLPSYSEPTPPDYDSPSPSPVRRGRRSLDHKSISKQFVQLEEQGPRGRPSSSSSSLDLRADQDEEDEEELDALDLLIQRTSLILSTSQSILASTISSRAQLSRFFALDDTLHQREGTLRREREPERRRDPRELLRRQGGGRGHPPRVATMYEAVESLPPRREEDDEDAEDDEGQEPSPLPTPETTASIAAVAVGEPPPATPTPKKHRRTSSAMDSLLRNSASLPTPAPTPPRLTSSSSATSLLSALASSSSSTLRRPPSTPSDPQARPFPSLPSSNPPLRPPLPPLQRSPHPEERPLVPTLRAPTRRLRGRSSRSTRKGRWTRGLVHHPSACRQLGSAPPPPRRIEHPPPSSSRPLPSPPPSSPPRPPPTHPPK